MASDMLTEWLVVLFVWLLSCVKEWVQLLLVLRGMVRMWWCDVEEKRRKRSGEEEKALCKCWHAVRQPRRACAGRHSVVIKWLVKEGT